MSRVAYRNRVGALLLLASALALLPAPQAGSVETTASSASSVLILGLPGNAPLSGTIVVRAAIPPLHAGSSTLGPIAILSVSEAWKRPIVARASRSGTVAFVLDTAQLQNGSCELTVSDLRGHSATRRVQIKNPFSDTGYFLSREGMHLQSRPVPDITLPSGAHPYHAVGYTTQMPAICSDDNNFEISFDPGHSGQTTLELRDSDNGIVRALSVTAKDLADASEQRKDRHRWSASVQWDGKDAQGETVPDGEYAVLARLPGSTPAYQSLGFVHKVSSVKRYATSTARPSSTGLRFLGLTEGQRLSGEALVEIAATTAPGPVLLLLDGEPVAAAPSRPRMTLSLDTARFANGPHALEARDFQGHAIQRRVRFTNPVSEVIYEPDFDHTSPDATPACSHVAATLPSPQSWSVAFVNARGRTVRTYHGTGRTIRVAWDGRGTHGQVAPYGHYEILLRHRPSGASHVSLNTLGYVALYNSGE